MLRRGCGQIREGRNAGIGTHRRPSVTGMLVVGGIHRDHHVKLGWVGCWGTPHDVKKRREEREPGIGKQRRNAPA